MYDGKTQLLIENPINRYLINSPMLPDMKKNADGSLTIYIQNKSPGQGQGSQLAAGAGRPDLHGHAPLLAEGDAAVDPAGRRRHLAAAGRCEGVVAQSAVTRNCLGSFLPRWEEGTGQRAWRPYPIAASTVKRSCALARPRRA